MDWRADRTLDEDFRKGAVESSPDSWGPAANEQDFPLEITLTEDVTSADSEAVHRAEYVLGADEEGTPG